MVKKWKPGIHFSPDYGWINDPNGLIYYKNEYHMFYQFYDKDTIWGPMHWGHVKSNDLLHWTQLPIALYPDKIGYIFSGSCIYDKDNVTGLGKPLIAYYTSHENDLHQEQQSFAYSFDGINFTKYENNPVITGEINNNRRDPEIIKNDIIGGYTMVLTEETQISFYHTNDLIHWKRSGTFTPTRLTGICECPCLFKSEDKWVLMISMILSNQEMEKETTIYNKSKHVMQYFVGTFDGYQFIDTEHNSHPLLTDYGWDYYAGVCFSGIDENLFMGWIGNWEYSKEIPTYIEGFRGVMSLPRKLGLRKTEEGYRLQTEIITSSCKSKTLAEGTTKLEKDVFELNASLPDSGKIVLGNGTDKISLSFTKDEYILDRGHDTSFSEVFGDDAHSVMYAKRTQGDLKMIWDRCVLEIVADDGMLPMTAYVFPKQPLDTIEISENIEASIKYYE